MARLLLIGITLTFISANAPVYAQNWTRDECIKHCQAQCASVPSPGKCLNQCTTMRCKG